MTMFALPDTEHRQTAVNAVEEILAGMAVRWGCHVLLESLGGRLADYYVNPDLAVEGILQALVDKRLAPIAEKRSTLKVLGLAAGATVVSGVSCELGTVVTVPISGAAGAFVWLVLPGEVDIDLGEIAGATHRLSTALLDNADPFLADGAELNAVLGEDRAVAAWMNPRAHRLRLVLLRSSHCSGEHLLRHLRELAHLFLAATAREDGIVVAVAELPGWEAALNRVLASVAKVDPDLDALVSIAFCAQDSASAAWAQLQTAGVLPRQAGTSRLVESLRSEVILQCLADPLRAVLSTQDDPVEVLRSQPRGGFDFCASLLAWLDAHGDMHVAAAELGVHLNTMRYRLRRVFTLLGGDLSAEDRLAIHLQLRLERDSQVAMSR